MSETLSAALERFAARLTALPAEAAGRVALAVRDEVALRTPIATGRLREGWRIAPGPGASVRIVNDVPYAAAVEYGTRGRAGAAMARAGILAVEADAVLAETAP
ncbi:MAG: HK97 gp10 family phage protein [Alphaproteobacteria bacterium]|nr:HK97 gp10 family phage protein [Alphaproteobacteria bacterium]